MNLSVTNQSVRNARKNAKKNARTNVRKNLRNILMYLNGKRKMKIVVIATGVIAKKRRTKRIMTVGAKQKDYFVEENIFSSSMKIK